MLRQADLAPPPSAASAERLPVRMWSSGKYALFNLSDSAAPPPRVTPEPESKFFGEAAAAVEEEGHARVALAISMDLVASGGDGVTADTRSLARLWDARSCRCLARLPHTAVVTCMALDQARPRSGNSLLRAGVRLATGSADGAVRVWHLRGEEYLQAPPALPLGASPVVPHR